MQYDPFRSSRDLGLTWPWPFKVILYIVRRALRRQNDGIKIVALPLKFKILSSKNRFGKFWNFDPWRPQFWPEPKNDRNDFKMIFSRAFEHCLLFFSTATRSRDHGGRSNTPPPHIRAQVNPRPDGPLDFPPPAGAGLCLRNFDCGGKRVTGGPPLHNLSPGGGGELRSKNLESLFLPFHAIAFRKFLTIFFFSKRKSLLWPPIENNGRFCYRTSSKKFWLGLGKWEWDREERAKLFHFPSQKFHPSQ